MIKKTKNKKWLLFLSAILPTVACTQVLVSCDKPGPEPTEDWNIQLTDGWRSNYVYGGTQEKPYANYSFDLSNFVGGEEIEFQIIKQNTPNSNSNPEICFDDKTKTKSFVIDKNTKQLFVPIGLLNSSYLLQNYAISFHLKAKVYWQSQLHLEFYFDNMWLFVGKPTTEDMFDIKEEEGVRTLYGFNDLSETREKLKSCSFLLIPEHITYIADNAFFRSHSTTIPFNLKYLILDDWWGIKKSDLKSIGNNAFRESSFEHELFLPDSIENIGMYAFYDTDFNGSLKLPESLKIIGDFAFADCENFIGDLIIPSLVVSIGIEAFARCFGFNGSLIFSREINQINSGAFKDCYKFEQINLEIFESMPVWAETTYKNDIFEGFAHVGRVFVSHNEDLWKQQLPTICGLSSMWIYNLSNKKAIPIKYLNLSKDSSTLLGITPGVNLEPYNTLRVPIFVTTIAKGAFKNTFVGENAPITSVDFHNGTLTSIEDEAFFGCTSLSGQIEFPSGLKTIGKEAFYNCKNLGSLVFAQSVETIGDSAFANCSNINQLDFSQYSFLPGWLGQPGLKNNIFAGFPNKGLAIVRETTDFDLWWQSITEYSGLDKRWNFIWNGKVVPEECFDLSDDKKCIMGLKNQSLYEDCNIIVLPNNITGIGNYAFSPIKIPGMENIHTIIFDNGVLREIGECAFRNATNFKCHICLPDTVETVNMTAFANSGFGKYVYFNATDQRQSAGNIFAGCYNINEIDLRAYHEQPEWLSQNLVTFDLDRRCINGHVWLNDSLSIDEINDWRRKIYGYQYLPLSWCITSMKKIVTDQYYILEDDGKTLAGINWDLLPSDFDTIKIPYGVTKIKSNAFSNLPSNATQIHNIDFYNETLHTIEKDAFNNTSGHNMTFFNLYLPSHIQNVGDYAFKGCHLNKSISLYSIWELGTGVFENVQMEDDIGEKEWKYFYQIDISSVSSSVYGEFAPTWLKRKGNNIFKLKSIGVTGNVIYGWFDDEVRDKLKDFIEDNCKLDVSEWSLWSPS